MTDAFKFEESVTIVRSWSWTVTGDVTIWGAAHAGKTLASDAMYLKITRSPSAIRVAVTLVGMVRRKDGSKGVSHAGSGFWYDSERPHLADMRWSGMPEWVLDIVRDPILESLNERTEVFPAVPSWL